MPNPLPLSQEEIKNLIALYTSYDKNNYSIATTIVSAYDMDMFDLVEFTAKEEKLFLINDLLQKYNEHNYFMKYTPQNVLWIEMNENYNANVNFDKRLIPYIDHVILNNRSREEMYTGKNFDIANEKAYFALPFPAFISELSELKILALDRIFSLQDEAFSKPLFELTSLEELTINAAEGNGFIIPNSIGNLSKLKSLQINATYCILPAHFKKLQALERLVIYGLSDIEAYKFSTIAIAAKANFYKAMQAHMAKSLQVLAYCKALQEIKLDLFEELPNLDMLAPLDKLESLTLHIRSILYKKLPKMIEKLQHLQQLSLIPMSKDVQYAPHITDFLAAQKFQFYFDNRKTSL